MQTASKSQAERRQWEEIYETFSRVVDGYGTPIDVGILELVVALNANGVHTTASCEGHLDWGNAYPWVRVGTPEVEDLEEQLLQSRRESRSALSEAAEETGRLQRTLRGLHMREEIKLVALLDAFYQHSPFVYDRHLVISHLVSGECVLASQGADLQDIREASERAGNLAAYQEEMCAFAAFLKEQFLGGSRMEAPKRGAGRPSQGKVHIDLTLSQPVVEALKAIPAGERSKFVEDLLLGSPRIQQYLEQLHSAKDA